MTHHDIVITDGGPAGLAAAVSARKAGVGDILILEHDGVLGEILSQCIHNGFGLHMLKEELTGSEYAARYIDVVKEAGILCKLSIIVIEINQEKEVTYINRGDSLVTIKAKAVTLAMEYREHLKGVLSIPGYRPAGIYSVGTTQRPMNIEGFSVGKEVVVPDFGNIGLIMVRGMTLEGAKVKVIAELMPYLGGLERNIAQCLNDYGTLLKLSHTMTDIQGRERVTGITLVKANENRKPIPGTEEHYSCDTLLLSVGLVLKGELTKATNASMNPITSGPNVSDRLKTGTKGIYTCGNVLHAHDLMGYVSEETALAGANAAAYTARSTAGDDTANDGLSGNETPGVATAHNAVTNSSGHPVPIQAENGVRYIVPQTIDVERMSDKVAVRSRVADVYKDRYITVLYDETVISKKKKRVLAPGEVEWIILRKESLVGYPDLGKIVIRTEME